MIWQAIGVAGTACFFTRMLLQWLLSEKEGRSLVPKGFWALSLAGALLLGAYTIHESQWILAAGHGVNGVLYVRNLAMKPDSRTIPLPLATLLGLLAAAGLVWASSHTSNDAGRSWVALAAVGQAVWSTRFVIQWWNAERLGRAELGPLFWIWSLVGNGLLLAYTLVLGDWVLVLGYLLGPFMQVRNLCLHWREAKAAKAS